MAIFARSKQPPQPAPLTASPDATSGGAGVPDSGKGSKRREGAEQLEVRVGDVLIHRAPPAVTRSLRYLLAGEGLPTRVGVTSSIHGEGVTSISRTLAALIASDWRHTTCWVDLNWWKVSAAPNEAGLFNVTMSDVVQGLAMAGDLATETSIPGLSFVAAGDVQVSSRARLTTSSSLADAVSDLSARFDYVVLDLPPVLVTSDAVTLSNLTDGFLLVVRQEAASSVQVQASLQAIAHVRCLGTVLNGAQSNVPRSLRTSNEVWALGT